VGTLTQPKPTPSFLPYETTFYFSPYPFSNYNLCPNPFCYRDKASCRASLFCRRKLCKRRYIRPAVNRKINVVKGEVHLDNRKYNGQIYVTTKTHDGSRLISLTELKDKYTEFKNKSVLFFVDESVVKEDYNKYLVDERYVLQIKVDTVNNPTENLDMGIIYVLTKSDANIKKSKEIRIRGGAVAAK
jgi:hypothetical protein